VSLTREAAWARLAEWTPSESLRKHALAVEAVMREASARYGAGASDERDFALAGMLHDADYERWPERHPAIVVEWLRGLGEARVAHAISAHYTKWGVPHGDALDRALLACDELTGFVCACSYVRPNGIRDLEPRSVLKRLKERSFAAKVERGEIEAGCAGLGVALAEHVSFVIAALRPHGAALGILGTAPP
jgi:predicted hydrolase (HD superfamily)